MRVIHQWWSWTLAVLCLGAASPQVLAHDVGVYENVTAEQRTLSFAGRTRDVLYLRPANATSTAPVPAVFLLEYLHGTAVDMADLTEVSRLVRDYGIWVILPASINGRWNFGAAAFSFADDVGFLDAVIDDAVARLPIDPHRLYMGGYSNGAQMTQRYICDRAERIAAGAIISGSIHDTDARQCKPSKPTPMIIFHGTADGQINYDGNLLYRSSVATAQFWAANAGCALSPVGSEVPDTVDDGITMHLDQYVGCTGGARIDHYSVIGGGHTWPGSLSFAKGLGETGQDLAATPTIWKFFREFSRP